MAFNLSQERMRVIEITGDTFEYQLNVAYYIIGISRLRINFLLQVLKLTIKYPQLELYLRDLLNRYTINELEVIGNYWSILHNMVSEPYRISLGAFEIIINHGININFKNIQGHTPIHLLVFNQCSNHIDNILNLLIKYGANLNIVNNWNSTVLDTLIFCQHTLNEGTRNCIMTLIDFGAMTNKPKQNDKVSFDFVESYKSIIIKPAIKK